MIETEANAKMQLDALREKYRIARPRDIGLGRQITRDWEAYLRERERLDEEVFAPAEIKIREIIGDAASRSKLLLDKRKRLQAMVKKVADQSQKEVRKQADETTEKIDSTAEQVRDLARQAIRELQETITAVQVDLQRRDVTDLSTEDFEDLQNQLETRIDVTARKQSEALQRATEQLSH